MGARIAYFKSNNDQELKELFAAHWTGFIGWYLHDFMDKDDSLLNENMAYSHFEDLDKRTVDELTSSFIGSYCERLGSGRHLLTLFGPLINKWHYEKSTELISETENEDFIRLWHFVVVGGRSLKDDTASSAEGYKIGFLAGREVKVLKNYMETYFGHYPVEMGLKCVLHALTDAESDPAGLITSID